MSTKSKIFLVVLFLLIFGALYYWIIYLGHSSIVPKPTDTPQQGFSFNPFNRSTVTLTPTASSTSNDPETIPADPIEDIQIPVLRHISLGPVGGYSASSTASSTIIRYIDRGTGHIYETQSITTQTEKISNTTIPKVYESYWKKGGSAFILRYTKDSTDTIVTFYGELRPTIASSSSNEASYEVKGKFLSSNIIGVAVSPKKDRIFTLAAEGGKTVGYISGFDESKKTKVFETPLTQIIPSWPEENTLAFTTKASGASSGFAYTYDIKKGVLSKVLGGITGMTSIVSADATKVLFSSTKGNTVTTNITTIKDAMTQDAMLKTFTDKCVWSTLHPNELYCAVPSQIPSGTYPDDWYRGNTSFIDQIWHLDTATGEVHLLINPLTSNNELIDATNLSLDSKEDFLYFINKRDLTLWSLDLSR